MASWFKGKRGADPEDATTRSASTITAHNPEPPAPSIITSSSNPAAVASPLPSQRQQQRPPSTPQMFSPSSSNSNSSNSRTSITPYATPSSMSTCSSRSSSTKKRVVLPGLDWTVAHRQTCLELGRLAVSTAAVDAHCCSAHRIAAPRGVDPASDPHYVVWNDQDNIAAFARQKLLPRLMAAASLSQGDNEVPASSFVSTVLAAPYKVLSTLASPVIKVASYVMDSESEYDQIIQQQQAAAEAQERDATTATEFPPEAVVVNVPLLSECHEYVSRILAQPPRQQQQQQHDSSMDSGVVVVSSLSQWILQKEQEEQHPSSDAAAASTAQFLARLAPAHWDLLVECLSATTSANGGHAATTTTVRKIPHRDPPLYALVRHPDGRSDPENAVEVAVTLYDLHRCKAQKEGVLAHWQNQCDNLGQQAVAAKRKGELASAKLLMQRRRHLLQRAEQEQQVLLNLETMVLAVEASVHQHATVQVLRSAADALKQARTGDGAVTLEDIDSVVDDLTEQVQDLDLTQGALGAEFVRDSCCVFDEDELMKELEALGGDDKGTTKSVAATSTKPTATATTLPAIQTQPISESTVATNSSSSEPQSSTNNKSDATRNGSSPPKKKHQVLAGSSSSY